MDAKQIIFTERGVVALQDVTVADPEPGQILIAMEQTIVSSGTELAMLSGLQPGVSYPVSPGYGSVGRVLALGKGVTEHKEGDRLFSYCKHVGIDTLRMMAVHVPEKLDGAKAVFARIGQVSITALRVSAAELGDTVAVIGAGPVGNLAAQLFTRAGCTVLILDTDASRLDVARRCGIAHQVLVGDDAIEKVRALTGGKMCATVVDATGIPAVAASAAQFAGKLGEVILLGSPRGAYIADATPVLNRIHLWGEGCVTYKGAHEWRYPIYQDHNGHGKHSLERNLRIILDMLADGRLMVDPLLTHLLSPRECQQAYTGLQEHKDEYVSVVFDWTLLSRE